MEEESSFFKRPIVKSVLVFITLIVVHLVMGAVMGYFYPKSNQALNMIIDTLICVAGLIGWMIFFAQFVLPVRHVSDRWKVVERLVNYLTGRHGPAIFIENGHVRGKENEVKKEGPGVIWLDSASAAILRTAGRFTRTIGPGVHFTKHGEYIAATADLHTLIQNIGPKDNDLPFTTTETNPDFKAIKERAETTSALTRDGIQVIASISVTFRIRSIPGEGNSKFGFNPNTAHSAIRDSMTRETSLDQPVWNSLPSRMAADIWREYLGKFRLSELFEKTNNRQENTLQFINEMMRKRLTKPSVEFLDAFGQVVLENKDREAEFQRLLGENNRAAAEKLLKTMDCVEFTKLTEMGLEVKSVSIKRLFFMPEVEDKLINQWTALWKKNALTESSQVDLDRKLAETTGLQDGLKNFALNASREIGHRHPKDAAHALEMLTHATFRSTLKNPKLHKQINNTDLRELSEMASWLRNQRGGVE